MTLEEAIRLRIIEYCENRNISLNKLATISGVSPSTLFTLIDQSYGSTNKTIKRLCDGLGISIREFYDSDLFDDLEQDIK